jgi:RNA polymerase sigma-70 factor (ECF subfamily)
VLRGDAEACHRFFREHYPDIRRYLLWLTERAEVAEDLAQETFVRAWRHLERFDGRASLRTWLHRIAHREFLRFLRGQRSHAPLETIAEVADTSAAGWTDAVELHAVIRKLPAEEGEVLVLHYLQGYEGQEIARIVGAPVSTVKYRLLMARSHLMRELGDGDLVYINELAGPMRTWAWLPLDEMDALETRLTRPADAHGEGENMERREFLRRAAVGAAGLMLAENDVVDGRLTEKVTLACKGVALSDLCAHLSAKTGVPLAAGPSVADEKVTVFCEKVPLREVMRQLSRPFGYTWLRSTIDAQRSTLDARPPTTDHRPPTSDRPMDPLSVERRASSARYRYELAQDMRSQLLEEELRSRDRNAALLALDREMERYRPFLGLSPEEAGARALTAATGDKKLLENLSRFGWGPVQMYFRLSRDEMAALRAGQTLLFSAAPRPGEQSLPPEVARGALQGLRHYWRVVRDGDYVAGVFRIDGGTRNVPDGLPPEDEPGIRVRIDLSVSASELGCYAFGGGPSIFPVGDFPDPPRRGVPGAFHVSAPDGPWAVGESAAVRQPGTGSRKSRLARDPALRARITVQPQPSCRLELYPGPLRYPRGGEAPSAAVGDRVTSADVLEALHRAGGQPIVADYYTRLLPPESVAVADQTLSDTLDALSETMRLRWDRDEEGGWLRFRSRSFYDDQLKEAPNRLLTRWSAARRKHGYLTLDELVEIAQLSDAQLDAASMAEGARACFGLVEWELPRHPVLRPLLRDLAQLTPAQRQEAASPAGLPFTRMSLAQQQIFIARALRPEDPPLQSLGELAGSVLRVDYTQPGWFEWVPGFPGPWQTWLMPVDGGRALRPPVRARTREAVLEALQRMGPGLRTLLHESMQRDEPRWVPPNDAAKEVYPTPLDVAFIYVPGASHQRPVRIASAGLQSCQWTAWGHERRCWGVEVLGC